MQYRISALVVLCWVTALPGQSARTATSTYCESFALKGPVQAMMLEDVTLDQTTGAVRARRKTSEARVSRDHRQVTIVRFEADTPYEARMKMFPTTVLEYDETGRLVSNKLKLDATTDFTVTECRYDSDGRVSAMTMRSRNPEFDNRRISFAYGPGWETERFQTAVANTLTTRTLDNEGKVIREIETDELRGFKRSDRVFQYSDKKKTSCYVEDAGRSHCTATRFDDQGNEVESKSAEASRITEYEYDRYGNWISRRVRTSGLLSSVSMELRQMNYWQ